MGERFMHERNFCEESEDKFARGTGKETRRGEATTVKGMFR